MEVPMRRHLRPDWLAYAGALAASVLLAPASTSAQAVTRSLCGIVTDASGSRLPGVNVTAARPQLITQQEVRTTSDQGVYRFPTLPPGTYNVTFDLSGFQPVKRENIVLLAGQSLAVDAQLQLS